MNDTDGSDNIGLDSGRRSLALALLGAVGGASLLKGCAPGALDESQPYDPEPPLAPQIQALTGATSLVWFDTYLELRGANGGGTSASVNVAVGRNEGTGGVFVWSVDTTSSDNAGTIIVPSATPRTGCWKRVYEGRINVKWFGALGDNSTPDTGAVQAAIDFAASLTYPLPVYFPPGTYKVSSLGIYDKSALIGAGRRQSTIKQIRPASGATPALVGRKSGQTGSFTNCLIRDLRLVGDDGYGGIGLELKSITNSVFENVSIEFFRKSDNSGVGLLLTNSADGGCFGNTFVGCVVADSNTGILMDSASGTFSCGYHRFYGLSIWQENDCIVLKNTSGNGSIYNLFCGVLLQGTGAGGKGIYCEGDSNTFLNIVEDGVPGNNIEFTTTASGNTVLFPSLDANKVRNYSTSGAGNTIHGLGNLVGGLGQQTNIRDVINGETTLGLVASKPGNGPEVRLATDAGPLQWRFGVSGSTSTAPFYLVQGSSNVEIWSTNKSSRKYGDLIFDAAALGVQLKDRTTGTYYRLKVDNGVLGIESV